MPLLRLGIVLVALWLTAVIVFKVVALFVHLLLIVAAVVIIAALVRRGARGVRS